MLAFEVFGFWGTYHAILGRSCYAKFMVVPNYYLEHKMPGPTGTITIETTMQQQWLFYSSNCCSVIVYYSLRLKILVVVSIDFLCLYLNI